jgi:hypothetical protein
MVQPPSAGSSDAWYAKVLAIMSLLLYESRGTAQKAAVAMG